MGCTNNFNMTESLRISQMKNNNKSYKNLKIENNYYIVCTKCQQNFPNIIQIDYDSKEKDFLIKYECECGNKGNELLIYLINEKEPINIYKLFIQKEIYDKIINILEVKKDEFDGFEIIKKIVKNHEQKINESVSDNDNGSLNISFSNNNIPQEYNKYTLVKTLESINKSRIYSLVQLHSKLILAGDENGKISAWDLEKPSPIKQIQEKGKISCLLEFEENMILMGNDLGIISLWNLNSEQKINDFIGHEGWVTSLVKCDDRFFASSSNDYNIIIWDYKENKKLNIIEKAHDSCVLALIKLKDNSICSAGADLQIKKWDWKTGECLFIYIGNNNMKLIRCLCECDDGTLLSGSDDNQIEIWRDIDNYKTLQGHEHYIKSICQIDNQHFASGSFDNRIKIWEYKYNFNYIKCVQTLEGHQSNVNYIIKLDDKENTLVSCSSDRTIKVWKQLKN